MTWQAVYPLRNGDTPVAPCYGRQCHPPPLNLLPFSSVINSMPNLLVDLETNLMRQTILALDAHLSDLSARSAECEDPDAFGYFDSMECATGLGFVACQTYMAAVYGPLRVEKSRAMAVGPRHPGGLTKAEMINHAANYWKHNNEWPLDRSQKRRDAIEAAFATVGFSVGGEYPLAGVLTVIADPQCASLSAVLDVLDLWKADMESIA